MDHFLTDRFAAIADIHGNVDALSAVLSDMSANGIRSIINLGDLFSGPLAAGETAQILRQHDMLHIRGNHDRYLLETDPNAMGHSDASAYAELSAEDLAWLRQLPVQLELDGLVFACHGTPTDDETYWLEAVTEQGILHARSLTEVRKYAASVSASLVLCAHTHIPRRVDLPEGRTILNPGSVGCPAYDDIKPVPHVVQTGNRCASYAIIERRADAWITEHRSVPYDTSRMVALAKSRGRTDWAEAIATGWLSDDPTRHETT